MASEQETKLRESILRSQIAATLPQMCEGELLPVLGICQRVNWAREKYGPLDLANDRRDWGREAYEEQLDGLFYLACGALKARG